MWLRVEFQEMTTYESELRPDGTVFGSGRCLPGRYAGLQPDPVAQGIS